MLWQTNLSFAALKILMLFNVYLLFWQTDYCVAGLGISSNFMRCVHVTYLSKYACTCCGIVSTAIKT